MRLLISTGEVSGDLQGSLLIKSLLKEAYLRKQSLELLALGGFRMREAGAHLIADTTSIGSIGLLEAIPFILPTLKAQRLVDDLIKKNPPDGVILIDYMGPNIRLGRKIKKLNLDLPIIYYIAPQEWAWRLGDGGTTDLISFTDKILAIFQDEADFYSHKGGCVQWVGHPMMDNLQNLPSKEDSMVRLGIPSHKKVLLLFPASRKQELKYILPILLKAASFLQRIEEDLYVLIPASIKGFEKTILESLNEYGVIGKIIPAESTNELKPYLFGSASLALGKSGTVNMELALHKVPQIVGYRVSKVTSFIANKFLQFHVDHISPVNLLLRERLIPELLQEEFTPENIVTVALPLLNDKKSKEIMSNGYERLSEILGEPGVTDRAAKLILDSILK